MSEYTVKIDDEFCEWTYELDGSDEYSIHELLELITNNTNLKVTRSFRSRNADIIESPNDPK